MIFEHRLIWKAPKSSPGEDGEAVSGSDEAKEDEVAGETGVETTEEREAREAAEAEDKASSDPDAELDKALEDVPDEESEASETPVEPEEPKSFMEQLKGALGYLTGDFFKDLKEYGFGHALGVLFGYFGGSAGAKIAEKVSEGAEKREDMAKKFADTLYSLGLPQDITVIASDVALLKTYKIKTVDGLKYIKKPKDLKKFFKAKGVEGIAGPKTLSDLILDLDVEPETESKPAEGKGVPKETEEAAPEGPPALRVAPSKTVDLGDGDMAVFQLTDGKRVNVEGDGFSVEGKKFKVRADGVDLVMKKITPVGGESFKMEVGAESLSQAMKALGPLEAGKRFKEGPVEPSFTSSQIVDLINALYENKGKSTFSQTYPYQGNTVNFEFIAA